MGILTIVAIAPLQIRSQTATLVLSRVNVVDVERGTIRRDVTVTIANGRIATIDAAGGSRLPGGAHTIAAAGQYLIPGLWDMHVHWYSERYLPLFIANGVVGVRQMFGAPLHLQWRERINRGELLGPRHIVGSTIVDGPNPVWPGSLVAATAQDGQAAVARIKRDGYDFVKVYNRLPRAAYFAIIEESLRSGMSVEGHVPAAVGVRDATAAGQRAIEHMSGLLMGASSAPHERERSDAGVQLSAHPGSNLDEAGRAALRFQRDRMLATYDPSKAAALIDGFRQRGTWHCPTLVVLRASAMLDDAAFTNDSRLKYMPPSVLPSWKPDASPLRSWKTRADYEVDRRTLRLQMQLVVAMQRAGVNLLAGTDVLNPYAFPGFSLHDELALLVDAGLTPAQALRTATVNPARYLGKIMSQGTVDEGKVADLVLLDANPVEDIKATTKIAAVLLGGRVFDRAALDRMLRDVEILAKSQEGR